MSKRGDWLSFNSFRGGEQSDLPPHEIPDDALLKASNVLTDKRGRLAKRGPIQPYLYNQIAATFQQIGVSKLNLGNQQPNLGWAVSNAGYHAFSLPAPPGLPRCGFVSAQHFFDFALSNPQWGPSLNSFGLCAFPLKTENVVAPIVFFGSPTITSQTTFSTNSGTVSVTANNQAITVSGPTIDSSLIGKIIYVNNNFGGFPSTTNEYIGVITAIDTGAGQVTVYPSPSKTWASGAGTAQIVIKPYQTITGKLYESGGAFNVPASVSFACVHQNRVVALSQATTTFSGSIYSSPVKTQNNVISWSAITGESATAASSNSDGLLGLLVAGWPKSQSLTIDTSGITGLVSLDANNLLVLCADKTLLISGVLGTVIPAAGVNTSSFNIRTVSAEIGCIDAASIQRTPLGVMFAGRDGVYITDGASFTNVMDGKVQQKWTVYGGTNSYATNKVTGSALLKDTHYAVFTEKGPHFICDLYNDFSWTEIEFSDSIYTGTPDPSYVGSWPALNDPLPFSFLESQSVESTSDGSVVVVGIWQADRFYVFSNGGSQSVPLYSRYDIVPPVTWTSGSSTVMDISNNGDHIVAYSAFAGVTARIAYYVRTAGVWNLQQDINIGTSAGGVANFGFAKNAGDRMVHAVTTSSFRVLSRSVSNVWSTEATITPPTSCSNVTMAAGGEAIALADTSFNGNRGRIYVYLRSGVTWTLSTTIDPPSANANAYYGRAMHFNAAASRLWIAPFDGANVGVTIHAYRFSAGTYIHITAFSPVSGNPGIATRGMASSDTALYFTSSTYKSVYSYTFTNTTATLAWQQVIAPNTTLLSSIGAASNGQTLYVGDFNLNFKPAIPPSSLYRSGGFHVLNLFSGVGAKPIWGIGVHDWSGSEEVYAPRLNANSATQKSDAIVLLDSILNTDEYPASSAIDASPVIDASCVTPFNAAVTTKAFALGDPTQLKAYKSIMMTYEADPTFSGVDPVGIRYAESLNPVINYTPPFLTYDEAPATLGTQTQSHRTSLIPRPIDNGIAFGFNTNYSVKNDGTVGSGRFKLYEFFLNVTGLRKGRTIQ